MVRSMTSPASAIMSYYLVKSKFTTKQILSITLVISGVLTACFVQLFFETKSEKFVLTVSGLFILMVSSMFNALQAVIE